MLVDRLGRVLFGLARFGIEEIVSTEPYLVAKTHVHYDAPEETKELEQRNDHR